MKKIVTFWILAFFMCATSILGLVHPAFFLLGLSGVPFGYIAAIITLTAYRLSPKGNDYQNSIHRLIVDASVRNGSVLDIGCGSGKLIIMLAKNNPGEKYTGIDFWGNNWEYSKQQCIENAKAEKVEGIEFMKGSASKLPFPDRSFDHVVSCLTFHEVVDLENKTDCMEEALRILKTNGTFTFFDLFEDPSFYRSLNDVAKTIEKSGGSVGQLQKLSEIMELKFPLGTKKVLKYGVLIVGKKG
jgi:ubiquinone/menaquinone biosynthesis C-methylase UbiE